MSDPDDSAFPYVYTNRDDEVCSAGGMTIRQAFVMAAMQGIASNQTWVDFMVHKMRPDDTLGAKIADAARTLADACLKAERESR